MYYDVTNRMVGVRTTSPQYPLDISGNAHVGNLYIQGNTITTDSGYRLDLGSISNITIAGGSTNYVMYTDGAGNLSFGNLVTILTQLDGFTGNSISLGSNTAGSLSSVLSLPISTTVTNAIALLNQLLGNITNNSGNTITVSGNVSAAAFVYSNGVNILSNITSANVTAGNVYSNNYLYANGVSVLSTLANYGNANVAAYLPTYTGNISASNITLTNTLYGNIKADVISPYITAVTTFNSQTAVGLPAGGTSLRPPGVNGYLRYNSDTGTLEYYAGGWIPLTNSITDQIITPDGTNQSYTLNQTTSAAGIIVSINGTVQRPSTAYTVAGTTITFTEIPLTTDIIDVRFIASASVTTTLDSTIVDTGNVVVGTTTTIIDSISASIYRSAKYIISSTNPFDTQYAEIGLIQNNGSVTVSTYAILRTGGNSVTYTANVNGSTVNLLATGTINSNQLRIQKTYFIV